MNQINLLEETERRPPDVSIGPTLAKVQKLPLNDKLWAFPTNEADWVQLRDELLSPNILALALGIPAYEVAPIHEQKGDKLVDPFPSRLNTQIFDSYRPHVDSIAWLPLISERAWEKLRNTTTQDLQPAGYLAGRAMTDFCAAGAAKGVPQQFVRQSDLLEFAITEASNSAFELALLQLMSTPEPFTRVITETYKTDPFFEEKILPFLTQRLNQIAKDWKSACLQKKGVWQQPKILAFAASKTILSCQAQDMQYRLWAEHDPEEERLKSISIEISKRGFSGWLQINLFDRMSTTRLRLQKSDGLQSAELRFDAHGGMRGRFGPRHEPEHFGWDEKGRLIWSGRQTGDGIWLEDTGWNSAKQMVSDFRFNPSGEIELYREWNDTGHLMRKSIFENGKPNGAENWWHPSGALAGQRMWHRGKQFGIARLYFENGKAGFDGGFTDDKLDDALQWLDEKGDVVFSTKFKQGLVHGPLLVKSREGAVLATASFDLGRAEGLVKIGKATLPFKSGVLDGPVEFNDKYNKRRLFIPFRAGKLHGMMRSFYDNNKLAANCVYNDNHLVAWETLPDSNSKPQVRGSVSPQTLQGATQTISDLQGRLIVDCGSQDGLWSICNWKIHNQKYALNAKDVAKQISSNTKTARVAGKLKKRSQNRCKVYNAVWDFSAWVERGMQKAAVDLIPSDICEYDTQFRCQVKLAPHLPIEQCRVYEEDHSHE